MKDTGEFLKEIEKQCQRFFPEAPVLYLEDLPFYIKARIVLSEECILEVRYNARNNKRSYALVRGGKRISGFDNLGGWHIHPFGDPEAHKSIAEPSLEDAFRYFVRDI